MGFALDKRRVSADLEAEKQHFPRFSRIPSSKKTLWPLAPEICTRHVMTKKPIVPETEGFRARSRSTEALCLLVNRHTASAAEMIVAFGAENKLASTVDRVRKPAGRLLSATSIDIEFGLSTGSTNRGVLHMAGINHRRSPN